MSIRDILIVVAASLIIGNVLGQAIHYREWVIVIECSYCQLIALAVVAWCLRSILDMRI